MSGTDLPGAGGPDLPGAGGPDLPPPTTPPVPMDDLPEPEGLAATSTIAPAAAGGEQHAVVVGPVPGRPSPTPESGRAARRRAAEESAREAADVSRRRLFITSGVVFGLVAAVFLVWAVFGRPRDNYQPAPSPSPSATGPVQPTLLVQVTDKDGVAVGNALVSVGGQGGNANANVITIPSTVVLDVATGGSMSFGQTARLPDPNAAANALSDAIGVNVDGTLTMNSLAFSGLVDAVGGITADVDVDVLDTKPDGTSTIVVPAGKAQVLQGPQAAAFATYLAPGEPEEARMARFTQVLRLTLAKLPSDVSKVESLVSGLGASARSTMPTADLAAFLVRLQSDVLVDNATYTNLPVKPLDTGGPSASRVDVDGAASLVQRLLPDAARKPGPNSKVRVLVENGVGSPGLDASARQLLLDAGFTYVNGGNAPAFGHTTTTIVVPDATPQSLAWGAAVASALKVPASDVGVASSGQTVADVIVVLGEDFKPPSP